MICQRPSKNWMMPFGSENEKVLRPMQTMLRCCTTRRVTKTCLPGQPQDRNRSSVARNHGRLLKRLSAYQSLTAPKLKAIRTYKILSIPPIELGRGYKKSPAGLHWLDFD